jgi:hypothetical protein
MYRSLLNYNGRMHVVVWTSVFSASSAQCSPLWYEPDIKLPSSFVSYMHSDPSIKCRPLLQILSDGDR